jgi:hypothetical protein
MPQHDTAFRLKSKLRTHSAGLLENGSSLRGTANSLEPIGWSPDERWLLVVYRTGSYESDAGGLSILLYDTTERRVIMPDLGHLVSTALKKKCSIRIAMPFRFDTLSRVHLRLADDVNDGDEESNTHCFQGQEEWLFSPREGTTRPASIH